MFTQRQLHPKRVNRMCSHNAVAAVHVGMRLDGFGEKRCIAVALVAGIQVFVIVFGDVFHIDGRWVRVWFQPLNNRVIEESDGHFDGVRPPVEKLVGESAVRIIQLIINDVDIGRGNWAKDRVGVIQNI